MKSFISNLLLSLLTMLLCGLMYPLLIIGLGMLMPHQSNGLPIYQKGQLMGFEQIGQNFHTTRYFWGRPSAVDYNAAATSGSNLANSNPKYLNLLMQRVDTLLKYHPEWKKEAIPLELIMASGSGLDPNISQKAALMQVKRIARIRKMDENKLIDLVKIHTEPALMTWLGPDKLVNVLKLNLALDKISKKPN